MRIRNILLSLICSVLLLQPAFPQCSGSSCPLPQTPRFPRSPQYGAPSYGVPYQNPGGYAPSITAEVQEKIKKASVRVAVPISSRTTAYGSGTLFAWGDSVGVLTAGHVVEDGTSVFIIHESLGNIPCDVHVYNTATDYALLEPREKQEELWELAAKPYSGGPLQNGSTVVTAGFAGNTVVTIRAGVLQRYATVSNGGRFGRSILIIGDIKDYINKSGIMPMLGFKSVAGVGTGNWMEIHGTARSGDSGGGIFTEDGRLIGNIWGSDMRNLVVATWFGPATQEIGKTCIFNWRRRPNPSPGNPNPGPGNPNSSPGNPGSGGQPPHDTPSTPGDQGGSVDGGASNGNAQKPDNSAPPPRVNEPSKPAFSWFEFFKPTLLVVLTYLGFLVGSGVFYSVALFKAR